MSELTVFPISNTLLIQRLQSAEKSIEFIQREHALTLVNLHEEVAKWQRKCSDLTFQLTIHGTIINSTDTNKYEEKINNLENQLNECENKIKDLNKILEEKNRLINDYEKHLLINNHKHSLELHIQQNKQRELEIELEQRAIFITQLTQQIHQDDKQTVRNSIRLGNIILPNKISKIKHNDEQQRLIFSRRRSNRSTSLSNRINNNQELTDVLFIGRHLPSTPSQQLPPIYSKPIESNDELFAGKRQRQLLNHNDMNNVTSLRRTKKLSNILPSIINKKMPLKALPTKILQHEEET